MKTKFLYAIIVIVILAVILVGFIYFSPIGNMRCGPCGCNNDQCGGCTPVTCAQLGRNCGTWSDYCYGTVNCGTCPTGKTCSNGQCVSYNRCGTPPVPCYNNSNCPTGIICSTTDHCCINSYVPCTPSCAGKVCGSDGCGGICGTCKPGCVCGPSGICLGTNCTA